MPASAGPVLTRVDIEAWSTEHLDTAATHWASTAQAWEDHFTSIHNGVLRPGGTVWEGQAAEAAAERTWGDLVKVRGAVDALHAASGHATNGASDVAWSKRQVLDAIADAEDAGFTVGQDLSVTDPNVTPLMRGSAQRQQQATEHADAIQAAVQALVKADKQTADRIHGVLAPLGEFGFPDDGKQQDPTVKAAGFHTVKEAPPQPPPPAPAHGGPSPGAADPNKDFLARMRDQLAQPGPPPGTADPHASPKPAEANPTLDPNSPAAQAGADQLRQLLRNQGLPPDQVEAQVANAYAKAQQPLPAPPKPEAPKPQPAPSLGEQLGDKFNKFTNDVHEGFYNRLDQTVTGAQDLTGTGGPGRPGVAESWEQLAKSEAARLNPLDPSSPIGPLGPVGAAGVAGAQELPKLFNDPGHYLGEKMFDGTAMAATAPFGAEGALGRALLPEAGALERSVVPEVGALAHDAAPAIPHHVTEPPPVVEHPTGSPAPATGHDIAAGGSHDVSGPAPVDGHGALSDMLGGHSSNPFDAVPTYTPPAPDVFNPHAPVDYTSGDLHHPGGWPPSTPEPTWTKGDSDPGWKHVNHNFDKNWMPYQQQIGGIERTPEGALPEWVQPNPETGAPVDFDGHTHRGPQEVFLEAKDGFRGLAFAPDNSYWEGRAEKALAQVQRQLAAMPPGAVLEWHVSDPYGAAALRRLFQDRLIYDVDIIYTPKAP